MTTDQVWHDAVRAHWRTRDHQALMQVARGRTDAGTRGSVTGGKHLSPLEDAVASLFRSDPDIGAILEVRSGGKHTLPGYYRRSKNWDIVVTYRGALVAAIEFKSQVGSIGNNHNNRTEEALGNSDDVWRAHEAGLLGPIRPWLAFVLVLEKSPASTRPVRDDQTIFPTDREFDTAAYLDRYRITFLRLIQDGKYDAAVVAASERGGGVFDEPVPRLSFNRLEREVELRLSAIKQLPDAAFRREPPIH